jgi:hypothetical protein
MNNMYDILAKMALLEGKVEKKEQKLNEARIDALKSNMEEASDDYSAKKARADGAVLAKLRKEDVAEADMEEGNDFTGARLAAIKAGKPTFKVDGKTYRVTGDTSDEKVMEREYGQRDDFDKYSRPGDTIRTTKGTLTKTASGVKHERRPDDEEDFDADDDAAPKKRGRPAGSKRALGAKGPTGKSKLLNKGAIKEGDLEEDMDPEADAGEYGREGDMAKEQLHTIEAAAEELSSILTDEQDLPEWVQKKITLAKEYVDTARDYMLAQEDEGEEEVAEVAPPGAKAERMVKHIKKGYAKDGKLTDKEKSIAYATAWKAKKAGKVEEEGKDEVEETTTAGAVATADAAPKGKKGGMQFGKGIYEGEIAESFEKKLNNILTEGVNINMTMDAEGAKSLTVTATDDDAVKLAQILKLAGMESASSYHDVCPTCGSDPCGCEEQIDEELANSPNEQYSDTDTMINTLSGGLNGPKLQVNPNNAGDNPLAMGALGKKSSPALNLGQVAEDVKVETENKLWELYQRYETK